MCRNTWVICPQCVGQVTTVRGGRVSAVSGACVRSVWDVCPQFVGHVSAVRGMRPQCVGCVRNAWAASAVRTLAPTPVWLAGGITPSNAMEAKAVVGAAGLDVNSKYNGRTQDTEVWKHMQDQNVLKSSSNEMVLERQQGAQQTQMYLLSFRQHRMPNVACLQNKTHWI